VDETFLVLAHARCFPKLIPQSRTIPEYCSSKSISNVFPTLPTIINHGQLPLIYPFLGVAVYGWVTIIYPHHLNIYIYVYIHCVCHHVTHVLDILHPQYIFSTPEWCVACHQPIVIRSFGWSPAAAMGIRIVASWGAAAHSGAMCRSWEATVIETVRLKFFFREKHLVVPKMWLFFPRWARRIVHKQSVETVLNFQLDCDYDLERFCFFGIAQFITHIFCLWYWLFH
jgi:hypothetical protein